VLCAGLTLGLTGLAVSARSSWSRAPAGLGEALPLEGDLVGQPLQLPAAGLDRIGLWFDKQGRRQTGAVEVHLLRGGSAPSSAAELWSRHVGHWDARVRGAGARVEVALPVTFELEAAAGQDFYLVLRRKQGEAELPLAVWLATGVAEGSPRAERLVTDGVSLRPADVVSAPLAVRSGYVEQRALRSLSWTLLCWCALGLVTLAFLALRARRMSTRTALDAALALPSQTLSDLLSWAVLALVAIVVLVTYGDYGFTWDEEIQSAYGDYLLSYYAVWFPDPALIDQARLFNVYLYGGLYDWAVSALGAALPLQAVDARHLLGGLTGLLGLAGCWRLGRELAGPRAGLLALLLAATTPAYLGHMYSNPKDLPFAVAYVWSTLFLVRLVRALPAVPPGLVLRFGLVVGFAMAIRVAGVVLLTWYALALTAAVIGRRRRGASSQGALRELGAQLAWGLLPASALSWAVMLFFWPWAQQAPLRHPLQALLSFGRFTAWDEQVLFGGGLIAARALPAGYLPITLAIRLPELLMLLLLAAAVLALWRRLRRRDEVGTPGAGPWAALLLAALAPPLLAVLRGAVLYDGVRHFIFTLPLLAVLAGWAGDAVLRRIALAARLWRWGAALLLAVYAVVHLSTLVRLHPYQYVYYNQLVGGVDGASGRYELDYWAASYREATRLLEQRLRREHGARFETTRFKVHACRAQASAAVSAPPNFEWVEKQADADYLIAFTRQDCHLASDGEILEVVERLGVPLTYVKKLR
jgi:hypothetical protein